MQEALLKQVLDLCAKINEMEQETEAIEKMNAERARLIKTIIDNKNEAKARAQAVVDGFKLLHEAKSVLQ